MIKIMLLKIMKIMLLTKIMTLKNNYIIKFMTIINKKYNKNTIKTTKYREKKLILIISKSKKDRETTFSNMHRKGALSGLR